MTLDQIYMLLCDKKCLRSGAGRRPSMTPAEAGRYSKDGKMRGRTVDGQVFEAKLGVGGKSYAGRLIEQEKQQQRRDEKEKRRRRARGE